MKIFGLKPRVFVLRAFAYAALLGFGFLMIFPFLYMIFTSFKTSNDVFRYPPKLLPLTQETVTYEGQEASLYQFKVEGETLPFVDTGERERFGFFTTEDLVNVADPRSSTLVTEIPLAEATETDRTLTLSAGDEGKEIDVYEVSVDGKTQELLLAYRGSKNRFVNPDDPSISLYAVERTAPRAETVEFQWRNYEAFFDLGLNRALVNTILVTLLVVLGQVVTSVFGGYAFSRVQFRGRDSLFLAYLGSIMIPFCSADYPHVPPDGHSRLAKRACVAHSAVDFYRLRHLFNAAIFYHDSQRPRGSRHAGRSKPLPSPMADFCAA